MRVRIKTFINDTDEKINEFLAGIPIENIVKINTNVYGNQESSDVWNTVIYKVEVSAV